MHSVLATKSTQNNNMKTKFLLAMSLTALALCGTAQAETIELTEDGQLADAINNAAEGDVIVLNVDQTITGRCGISNKNNLTIKGANGNEKITRQSNGWKNSQTLLLINNNSTVTFRNLTIDGGNYGTTNANQLPVLVESNGARVSFDNVTFINHKLDRADMGIIKQSGGQIILADCTFSDNTITAGSGDVLTNGGVTAAGNTSASFMLNTTEASVKVGEGYTGQSTLAFVSTVTEIPDNTTVVEGATTGFALNNMPSYELVANNGNLEIVKKQLENKAVVNETTFTGYDTLEEALAALESGKAATLLIQKPLTVNQQITNSNGADLTIKGPESGVTLTRGFDGEFWVSSTKNLTLQNLTLDENHKTNTKGVINVGAGTSIWLTDVNIINSDCQWEVIFNCPNKNARVLLNNVFCENCPENKSMVKFNKQVLLQGDTNLKLRVAAASGYTITVDGPLANTAPIAIDFEKAAYEPAKDGSVVLVHDCTEPSRFSVPEGFVLEAKDGNLVVVEPTSTIVETLNVDSDTPAEFYNLQGMKVQNPVASQIYILKKGSKISKVVF